MSKASTHYRSAKTGQFIISGRAKDGTEILRQAPNPSSFTRRDAERIVEGVKLGRGQSTTVREHIPSPGRGDTKK